MVIFTFLVLIIFLGYYFLSLKNTFGIIPFNTNSDLKKKKVQIKFCCYFVCSLKSQFGFVLITTDAKTNFHDRMILLCPLVCKITS